MRERKRERDRANVKSSNKKNVIHQHKNRTYGSLWKDITTNPQKVIKNANHLAIPSSTNQFDLQTISQTIVMVYCQMLIGSHTHTYTHKYILCR